MAKIDFYTISKEEKEAVFNAIAGDKGMKPFAVEKDWWVSRTLEIIFQMSIAKHLVFKGGTSLSKAWKLINRFSEDIDLAIDKEIFITPQNNWSRGELSKLRIKAGDYSTGIFFKELQAAFSSKGYTDITFKVIEAKDSDQDPRIIEIYYPHIIESEGYLIPRVQVEIGCRSLREPFTVRSFGSLVDETYAGSDFAMPFFDVPTVNPERTFLEKLFLLHEEFSKPIEKIRIDRLSRHMYDLYHLDKAGISALAINDKELYETIVTHRHTFTKVSGVDYNHHNPKTISPLPQPEIITEWQDDYSKMKEDMIYDESKPSFDDLISNLNNLKSQLQAIEWEFELSFPIPNS